MTDINSVVLVGRITKDVGSDERSFSYVGNGTAKAVVNIAVNRGVKKGDKWEDEASFFDVVIWGKLAEAIKPKIEKGVAVLVQGRLQQDRWEKDGQKKSRVYINAESIKIFSNGGKDTPAQVQNFANEFGREAFPEDTPF